MTPNIRVVSGQQVSTNCIYHVSEQNREHTNTQTPWSCNHRLLNHKACEVITTFRKPEETEKAQVRTEFGCLYRREVLEIAQADGKNQHYFLGQNMIREEAHTVVRFGKRRNKRLTTLYTTHVSPQHPTQRETCYDTQTKYGQQMSS